MNLWVYKKENNDFDFIRSINKPNNISQRVDNSLKDKDTRFLIVSESIETDDQGVERTVYNVSFDQGSYDAWLAEQQAQQAALSAFQQLNADIEADAAETAGTTNQISALMDYLTYLRMKNNPELFDQEGIVAKKAVGTFNQGDALNTALKVEQYAEAMLAESDAFMIRRLKAITNYIIS